MRQKLYCLSVVLLLGTCTTLFGQVGTGSFIGHVTDASGAVIPGVNVTATNTAKGEAFRAITDAEGVFRFYYLMPGTYTLKYEHAGFETLERHGIALQANETPEVDAHLAVGSAIQRIDVTAAAPQLETTTSSTGTVMEGTEMNALPIQQRYTWMALYYMPDVSSMGGFHADGMRDRGMAYEADGIGAAQPIIGGEATATTLSTTPNAIEEVKVTSTVLPAEYGHSAAGMESWTYKSGTNKFHFEGEDRYFNTTMYPRSYFTLSNVPEHYHELSSMVSGPVFLPGIYNGRNKTFFMFGWSMHHEEHDYFSEANVPTAAELQGNFSFNGLGYPVYDPATVQEVNGQWTATPFPGNIVPTTRFDAVAAKFLSYTPWYPANNYGNAESITATGPINDYGSVYLYHSFRTRTDTKIDHYFSEKNRMFGRWSEVLNRATSYSPGMNWIEVEEAVIPTPSNILNAVLSDSEIFSPHLINEVHVGIHRYKISYTPPGLNAGWAGTLGIPGVSGVTFPEFVSSTGAALYGATPLGGSYYQVTTNDTLQDNLTLIRGGHSLRMGFELIKTTADSYEASIPGGEYYMGGTGYPFKPNTGNDFAGFLLGSVVTGTYNTTLATWLPRWWSPALYFQDDWVVNRKLALNLGLRWSFETPYQTKYAQQSNFNPTGVDSLTGLPGADQHPTGELAQSDFKHFQPRIGGAYRVNDKGVFRAGFGLNTIDLFVTGVNQNFDEYQSNVSLTSPVGNPSPKFFLSQGPGPINYNILSNGTSPYVGTNYSGRTATYMTPHLHNAYAMNWNAGYQYQLAPNWLMEVSYKGSSGVGLLEAWNMNTVPFNVSTNPATLQTIFQNYQNYVPYPNFGAINEWGNFGHSTFHSGTIKFEKRFTASGTVLQAFYTRSKAIDDCDNDQVCTGESFYDRRLEKGRAGFDLANRVVAYATYPAPLGRSRRFMNRGGALDYIFGGWNLTWVQTFQSGTPVTFTMAGSPYNYLPGNAAGALRPNQVLPDDQVQIKNWTIRDRFNESAEHSMWNIEAFDYPAAFTLGTEGRNTIEGPHLLWSEASIAKDVKIFHERADLEVRFDVNNVFKNPNFANPSSIVNFSNPIAFGKPTATVQSSCCIGGQPTNTLVVKVTF